MDVIEIRAYCLAKPFTDESLPFDDTTLVFKVMGKIFALLSLDEPEFPSINLKCDPDLALELQENHPCVIPGYHMNKKLWNTVIINGSVSDQQIREWIDHSYDEVVKKLPKKLQQEVVDALRSSKP